VSCVQLAAKELAAINAQYPFTPLKWLPETLRLTFAEGIQMLKDAGHEVGGNME
jgi:aspartyl-tRNA synthetase